MRNYDQQVSVEDGHEIAVSVFLPDPLPARAPVLALFPGGGFSRGYFDLPVEGFSQAARHTANATIVIAIDHLGVGASSIPTPEETTLQAVAAANHAAVRAVLEQLSSDVEVQAVIGAGQSMGGHIVTSMQAYHRTFDAIAMLGSSVAGTTFPMHPDAPPLVIPEGTTDDQLPWLKMSAVDWPWAFHWNPIAGGDPGATPHDLESLVAIDIACGVPARTVVPPWGTDKYPAFVATRMVGAAYAAEAAAVDVPVLLAAGERDVMQSFAAERAMYTAATDVEGIVLPHMAHMHNFSETRQLLWSRLDEYVAHVTRAH